MNKESFKDKKGLLRKLTHLTRAPRMEGRVKNANMNSPKKKGKSSR